jgi:hypothetical protein
MTPEERAWAKVDEMDGGKTSACFVMIPKSEVAKHMADAIRGAEIEVALHFQAEVNRLVLAIQLAEQRIDRRKDNDDTKGDNKREHDVNDVAHVLYRSGF